MLQPGVLLSLQNTSGGSLFCRNKNSAKSAQRPLKKNRGFRKKQPCYCMVLLTFAQASGVLALSLDVRLFIFIFFEKAVSFGQSEIF